MFVATGTAIEALVDAVKSALSNDVTLSGLVTGVYGYVPEGSRRTFPYLKIGDQAMYDDFGAMQVFGGRVTFPLDGWSEVHGPHEMRTILARVLVVLERADLTVANHVLVGGSLHCTEQDVIEEPDEDMPDRRLYHGHMEWEALVEEA